MKIVLATDNYYPNINGASVFAMRLARKLKDRGHEVLVIAPGASHKTQYSEHDGVRIFGLTSFPFKGIWIPYPLFVARKIRKALKDFQPDIVHLQCHFLVGRATFLEARKLKIPVVGTNHFMPENLSHYLHLPKPLEHLLNRLAWKHFCRTYRHLARITSPTRTAANLLNNVGLNREVMVISNGIDLSRFHPSKRKTLKQPTLVFVGRLDKEKHIEQVILALHQVKDRIDMEFHIGGKGAQKKYLQALVKKFGLEERVKFLGFVPDGDLPILYASADCAVTAGIAELQSISSMEAMACGLPVIAVNAMALPELVSDGENGFLFEPGDIRGLGEALVKVFSDEHLRRRMSQKSLELIAEHDINKVVSDFENLYRDAAL